jgi:hypothetical protein
MEAWYEEETAAVAEGSACEFTPKSKAKSATPRRYFP